ncbi:MAG TPA: glycosyltransferase family 39 protein [Sedimentisphaerales bacterium]|nr:glycosyltransferase family 39 protein [Sedimentisphaerales bacterium]
MDKASDKYKVICVHAILALSTLAVYWQVRGYDFVNFDDPDYVSQNKNVQSGFSLDSIKWAFTTGHAANWHPLTWLSHMLDRQIFGADAGGHHLTNLLLHIANILLLFAVLKRMTGALWRSAFVAALFALHPLHVESVAWVAERKDVLSTLFWMLTMAAYVRYVTRPQMSSYLLTLVVFALGLMAKPMLVTLPFVLLLLDYWPLGRLQNRLSVEHAPQHKSQMSDALIPKRTFYKLVLEKIPFVVITVASSIVTFIVQRKIGAVATTRQFPFISRIANAFASYMIYIRKMFWPSRLAMFYPYPRKDALVLQAAIAIAVLLLISLAVLYHMRSRRYLLTGWLWYLGTLVPVIGLVQVGDQAHADRYTYIPLTGLFIIIAWGVPDLLAKWRFRRIALAGSVIVILPALSFAAHHQQSYWSDTITLCEHAIDVTEDNHKAHYSMMAELFNRGEVEEAIRHGREAVRIRPNYAKSLGGLAAALAQQGKTEEAVMYYNKALLRNPDLVFCANNLAMILATHKDAGLRNPKEAVRLARHACELTSYESPPILDTLAAAYAADGRFSEAVETAEKALQLADSTGEKDLARKIHDHLMLFQAGRPYVQP